MVHDYINNHKITDLHPPNWGQGCDGESHSQEVGAHGQRGPVSWVLGAGPCSGSDLVQAVRVDVTLRQSPD